MTPPQTPAPTPTPTPPPVTAADIKGAAAAKGIRFGSAVAWSSPGADAGSFANPAYAALLEQDCAILVPENELKWQSIRPNAASFDFTRFDAILGYAEAKGMAMRGHTLLWHQRRWMPAWAESHDYGTGTAEAARVLTEHIQTICRRYGSRIASYDVVNEAVDPASGNLYETALSQALGGAQATLDLAFRTARAEAPTAQLVYNDYMGWEGGATAHHAGVLALLRGFRARGVPVDALGIQSHIGIYSGTPVATLVANQSPAWRAFLDEVVGMGYRLVVSELDVRDTGLPADIAVRDQAVADYTRGYLDLMLGYPQLRDVLVWGMSDKYNWLQSFEPRADGQPRRPCPYDSMLRPKLMQNAIHAAIVAAAAR
ncbi:MAG: endo-1,4-beta-xylanase [Sphingomonas sp.]|uniref:endo-1,4-beta-xylanase n=1 Tax=Sphingomonas sp. TaxID=28214 RepID=UPI0022723EA0|nr:endo-1,4-beta-xylanase [Sphingomonas sp.]MCX8477600.1 endo-1,4-beta-xylanase [Sphingomonas sp.]